MILIISVLFVLIVGFFVLSFLPCPVARLDVAVVDIGQPAEWVKVNVQKTVSCSLKWVIEK